MKDLNKKAFGGLLRLIIGLAASLFLPDVDPLLRQAWIFLAVFSLSVLAITIYLMKKDPKLLERRMNAGSGAEKEKSQKIIQFLAAIAFIAVLVFPAIDHRFAWSTVPPYRGVHRLAPPTARNHDAGARQVNLIQAQRDYFGAHTCERIDAKGAFHTKCKKE